MTNRLRITIRSDREGQTLAIVAVSMVALLALLSLGIDLGMAYTARVEAQRVADSAALAGASAFLDYVNPLDAVGDARGRAGEYAERNFVRNRQVTDQQPEVMVWVTPESQRVRVRIERGGLPTWFARLLGQEQMRVSAVATAEATAAGSSKCVKPLAIPDRWEERSTDPVEDKNGDQIMDFDKKIPCEGVHCNPNEVWTFEPGVDEYRPLNKMGTFAETYSADVATSWGSHWRTDDADAGARILLTPQSAQGTGTPGWYQYWKMPGTAGANDLTQALQGCIDLSSLGIGDVVDADPQPGNIGNPVYKAFETLWKGPDGDADIEWDAENKVPHYPKDPTRSIWDSPRVFTVLLVHPADIQPGASHTMRIADLATVFLENPHDHYNLNQGNDFKAPIWGRLFHYGHGESGPEQGSLQKYLRLVE
jgi:Flp pilus assembly protein TadG